MNDVFLSAKVTGVCGEVSINDVPVLPWFECDEPRRFRPRSIMRWLRPGTNTVEIHQRRASTDGRSDVEVEIVASESKRRLLRWSSGERLQPIVTESFEAPTAPPTQLWRDAQVMEFGQTLRGRALALATDVHRASSARDPDAIVELQAYALRERARIHGRAHAPEHARAGYAALFAEGIQVRPFRASELVVELYGHGRIVTVTRPGHAPAVVLEGDDGRVVTRLDLHLAQIGGVLTWVRS